MIFARLQAGMRARIIAITDEPDGGSAAPTGKMQLTGELSG